MVIGPLACLTKEAGIQADLVMYTALLDAAAKAGRADLADDARRLYE